MTGPGLFHQDHSIFHLDNDNKNLRKAGEREIYDDTLTGTQRGMVMVCPREIAVGVVGRKNVQWLSGV